MMADPWTHSRVTLPKSVASTYYKNNNNTDPIQPTMHCRHLKELTRILAHNRFSSSPSSMAMSMSMSCFSSSALEFTKSSKPSLFSSRRSFAATTCSASIANENREFVIVGGGNAAGYAARSFVENDMANGKLCIVSNEKVAPYERPALTKAYIHPLDKKPARLPGFHTCVGSGGERQTAEWYNDKGIEVLYDTTVSGLNVATQTLTTASGTELKYGSLIIATGCSATRLPNSIGGNLTGVHYIRNVADADSLVSSMERAKKVVIIGGGYIGMEVAAAAVGWKLETTVVFPEEHMMPRLFPASLAKRYEKLYEENGVKFCKGALVKKLISGPNGKVVAVQLEDGRTIDSDMVVVGIGAKPVSSPFQEAGLKTYDGGLEVDGQFRTSVPGIFAVGDVAAFPLKMYGRRTRVEHVDHARKSAQHCVDSLLNIKTEPYDYLPYFYSRVFEYEGSSRKVWWQFYGDNVGEIIEVGDLTPKCAVFWVQSGRIKGVFLESGSSEEFAMLPKIARKQPSIQKINLQNCLSVEEAFEEVAKCL